MVTWNKVGGGEKPEIDKYYLVTIYKDYFSTERVVVIGAYQYSPFSGKNEWTHEERTIAFAEIPEPYSGRVEKKAKEKVYEKHIT